MAGLAAHKAAADQLPAEAKSTFTASGKDGSIDVLAGVGDTGADDCSDEADPAVAKAAALATASARLKLPSSPADSRKSTQTQVLAPTTPDRPAPPCLPPCRTADPDEDAQQQQSQQQQTILLPHSLDDSMSNTPTPCPLSGLVPHSLLQAMGSPFHPGSPLVPGTEAAAQTNGLQQQHVPSSPFSSISAAAGGAGAQDQVLAFTAANNHTANKQPQAHSRHMRVDSLLAMLPPRLSNDDADQIMPMPVKAFTPDSTYYDAVPFSHRSSSTSIGSCPTQSMSDLMMSSSSNLVGGGSGDVPALPDAAAPTALPPALSPTDDSCSGHDAFSPSSMPGGFTRLLGLLEQRQIMLDQQQEQQQKQQQRQQQEKLRMGMHTSASDPCLSNAHLEGGQQLLDWMQWQQQHNNQLQQQQQQQQDNLHAHLHSLQQLKVVPPPMSDDSFLHGLQVHAPSPNSSQVQYVPR